MSSGITNSLWGRRLLAGFLTWLIPFIVAIPFYGRDGALLIDTMLFKSLMIVVASITSAAIMVWFFSLVTTSYAREALITGTVWLVMNWALDLVILVGLLGMAPLDYILQIGLRYIMIPAMVLAAGIVADHAMCRKNT
jgi:hypothetical protein